MESLEEKATRNALIKNNVLSQIIEQASLPDRMWPGCNFLADVLNHEGIISDQWMLFLELGFEVVTTGYPTAPAIHLTLSSQIEKAFGQGNADGNPFFEFKSYIGVDRRIFKSMHGEYQKFKTAIEKELSANGSSNWPFFVFPMKAYSFITAVDEYEIEEVGENEYLITARQRGVVGYYTVYINLRGSLDSVALASFETT